ncbi:HAD family hydrolase [Lactobacillus crispatus]|uniref:HAD-IA family hydrolase n=1 Tax=Lactobacillus crispatus TaxID=47770 RepID=A0A7X4KTD2_9LACO|nr:HAD family hydrolase [Lactobacillus crispatus]EST03613.1 hypothetical protein Lc367_0479 [Lactobacillus crispatus EM-LC1]KAA8810147.1 HAD family hydrolase [Lactobacillus crispatus]MYN53813.1 HAD-IA family hydrolase [Lactobacillus crispatus]
MDSIIFDLGNTLKKDLSVELIRTFSRQVFKLNNLDRNIVETFEQTLLKKLNSKDQSFTAKSVLTEIIHDNKKSDVVINQISQELARRFVWNSNAARVLCQLKKSGHDIFLLSNSIWNSKFYILENEEYFSYFTNVFFSDQTGYRKPSLKAFLNIIDYYGLLTNHVWMIGDSEKNDILPAKGIGIKTIRIADDNNTEADYKCNSLLEITNIINIEGE